MIWLAAGLGALLVVAYYAVNVATFQGTGRVLAEWLVADVLLRCVLAVGVAGLVAMVIGMSGHRIRLNPLLIASIVAGASVLPLQGLAFINERGRVEVDPEDRWNLGWLTCLVCALASLNLLAS